MFKLSSTIFIVSALTTSSLVQAIYGPCGNVYQTTDMTGVRDTRTSVGTPCTPSVNNPAGSCETAGVTAAGVSAVCQLTYYTVPRSYICCYSIMEATFSTPDPGSTFVTLDPGSTGFPQFLKPKCPNGIPGSIVGKTNVIKQCNITRSMDQNCPAGFTCSKASNVVDVFGTVTLADDLGASITPYLCCNTEVLSGYYKAFSQIGLYPNPMPWTNIRGILSVKLGSTVPASIGDDVSYISGQLAASPLEITLLSKTSASMKYHVYMFDSDNGKECAFFANIVGDGTTVLKLPDTKTAATAPVVWLQVYRSTLTNVLAYEATAWKPTMFYTTARRWVVIVWQTTADLVVGANSRGNTNLNLKAGLYGDFEPSAAAATKGAYVSNTVALNRIKTVIRAAPIAATYFFVKT